MLHREWSRSLRAGALSVLLAGVLLGCFSPLAGAFATYDARGEWSFVVTCSCTFPGLGTSSLPGKALISKMEFASGEFSGSGALETSFGGIPTTISGTASNSQLSPLVVNVQSPEGYTTLTVTGSVESGGAEMSGSGEWKTPKGEKFTGTFSGKRLRTWEAIEQEKIEQAEQVGREKGETEGKKEGLSIGEKKGLETGEKAGLEKGAVEGKAKAEQEVKLKAEQEAKEAQAREAQAKTEREAREKSEREAAQKADTQAREKIEQEAREKVAKEAQERRRAEAKKKHRKRSSRKRPKPKPKGAKTLLRR
jgi:hypothetical protein